MLRGPASACYSTASVTRFVRAVSAATSLAASSGIAPQSPTCVSATTTIERFSVMRIGIIGLPAAGKTTLFNLLCQAGGSHVAHQSAKEPNVAVVKVPDPRLDYLAALFKPKKLTPATIEFIDFVALTRGAGKGEGLGSHYLSQMRQVDAILHVLRDFDDPGVAHVETTVDPIRDATPGQHRVLAGGHRYRGKADRAPGTGPEEGQEGRGDPRVGSPPAMPRLAHRGETDPRPDLHGRRGEAPAWVHPVDRQAAPPPPEHRRGETRSAEPGGGTPADIGRARTWPYRSCA